MRTLKEKLELSLFPKVCVVAVVVVASVHKCKCRSYFPKTELFRDCKIKTLNFTDNDTSRHTPPNRDVMDSCWRDTRHNRVQTAAPMDEQYSDWSPICWFVSNNWHCKIYTWSCVTYSHISDYFNEDEAALVWNFFNKPLHSLFITLHSLFIILPSVYTSPEKKK